MKGAQFSQVDLQNMLVITFSFTKVFLYYMPQLLNENIKIRPHRIDTITIQ